ncbi:MAG: MiaB/RimO family radical SAM methylthiotransferase [Desulfarculaceae bacterium]
MNDTKPIKTQAGTFVVSCLGCKVNQAEAAHLIRELTLRGWSQAGPNETADLAVVFTCAVTGAAARQSRQAARRLARTHPQARVVVTSCGVQVEAQAFIEQGFSVLGRADMGSLPDLVSSPNPGPSQKPGPPDSGPWVPGIRYAGEGRSRALLKVQDGCNAGCAYCIVPLTRGRPRSLPLEQACSAFAALGDAGSAEVVLTGVHLGRYGADLEEKTDLAALIEALLHSHPLPRIRLSSLEVNEINDSLIDLLAFHPRICRHLHIPLQSGSDRLLRAMGRPYQARDFASQVEQAHERVEGICLGADVLAGLPGEDQQAFAQTRALIENLPLSYLHVFPFSRRPGTRAAAMPAVPPEQTVKERAATLRGLGQAKRRLFLEKQPGNRPWAVMEDSGMARTDNYCLVKVDQPPPPGSLTQILIQGLRQTPKGPQLTGIVI